LEQPIAWVAKVLAVAFVSHVLIDSVRGRESSGASVALELRGMVARVVHVLIACTVTAKLASACIALDPMVFIVHMLITVILVVEFLAAAGAFEHLDGR
jgi:hypothetical protein